MKVISKIDSIGRQLMLMTYLLSGLTILQSHGELSEYIVWRYIEFSYDNPKDEAAALENKMYIYSENIPVDVDVSFEGKIFITLGRNTGVPASLTTVTPQRGYGGGPLLKPYPDWSWADPSDCNNLIGVFRIAIDDCNRLWVIDSGTINDDLVCPPKLMAFNTTSDEVLVKEILPDDVVFGQNGETKFLNILVDTVGTFCEDTNVYLADAKGYGMVVWNRQYFWRIEAPYFNPEAEAAVFSVEGDESTTLARGLLGMSIARDESVVMKRLLYFRPLSSYSLYNVHIVDLHRFKMNQAQISYVKEPSSLNGQSISQAFSKQGILFYSSVSDNAILCWNRNKTFEPENTAVIAMNDETLQWATGIKVITTPDNNNEMLWVLTNRWQRVNNRDLQFTDSNFRVLIGSVEELINGTVCQ